MTRQRMTVGAVLLIGASLPTKIAGGRAAFGSNHALGIGVAAAFQQPPAHRGMALRPHGGARRGGRTLALPSRDIVVEGINPRPLSSRSAARRSDLSSSSMLLLSSSAASDADGDEEDEEHTSRRGRRRRSPQTSKNRGRERPEWALPWMPTALVTMRPAVQIVVAVVLYAFHLTVLTQHQVVFPIQLIPNERGWFQSVGLDSLAGMFSLALLSRLRRATKARGGPPAVPSLWSAPTDAEAPWKFPSSLKRKNREAAAVKDADVDDDAEEDSAPKSIWAAAGETRGRQRPIAPPSPKASSVVALLLLTYAYFNTGRFANLCELGLYDLAGLGLPLTIAMHRSLVVLLGHVAWILAGSSILRLVVRPQPFFGGGREVGRMLGGKGGVSGWIGKKLRRSSGSRQGGDDSDGGEAKAVNDEADAQTGGNEGGESGVISSSEATKWYTSSWDTYWLWWAVGGYFVSSWVFNVADFVNQLVLPSFVFTAQPEGVVSQLINPENNDLAASIVGYIAPCITAPWWEEVLYRGFMLPALALLMGYWPAVYVSGIIFSAHHMSWTGAIPLAFLGWTWAAIYAKSGNLLVTVLIHAMWNSRVFLGSWLGL